MRTALMRLGCKVLGPQRFEKALHRGCASTVGRRVLHLGAFVHSYCVSRPSPQIRAAALRGYTFYVNICESIGYTHYFFQEDYVPRWLHPAIARSAVFLDVGANMGSWTMSALSLMPPAGRVFAIECNPQNAALIRRSLAANGSERRVEVVEYAVADQDGLKMRFHVSEDTVNSGRSWLVRDSYEKSSSDISIETITLDTFADRHELGAIDFMKMDIERAEDLALKGFARHLRDGFPHLIFIELALGGEAHRVLMDHGYRGLQWDGMRLQPIEAGKGDDDRCVDILAISPTVPTRLLEVLPGSE